MTSQPAFWALIPAAGTGTRMGGDVPKQYLKLGHRSVLEHTLELFIQHKSVQGIMVVLAEHDPVWPTLELSNNQKIHTAAGGTERYHSVYNGLKAMAGLARADDWVMVHDAARPCLRLDDIDRLIDGISSHVNGCILATPVKDTIKRTGPRHEIVETIDRNGLWHALTPQLFRLSALESAFERVIKNKLVVTDEAQAMEAIGTTPDLLEGHSDNIKITRSEDLLLARFILEQQGRKL